MALGRSVIPRAQRYRFPISLHYREVGRKNWLTAEIVNISESGVLFGSSALRLGAVVEVMLALPIPLGSLPPGKQMCVGAVVRATSTAVATCFEECRGLPS